MIHDPEAAERNTYVSIEVGNWVIYSQRCHSAAEEQEAAQAAGRAIARLILRKARGSAQNFDYEYLGVKLTVRSTPA